MEVIALFWKSVSYVECFLLDDILLKEDNANDEKEEEEESDGRFYSGRDIEGTAFGIKISPDPKTTTYLGSDSSSPGIYFIITVPMLFL